MNPIITALLAILRRLGIIAGIAIIGTVAGGWSDWLVQAINESGADAKLATIIWILVEFVQKLIREAKKAPVTK